MGRMLNACVREQKREGIYDHPLSWCAREAIRSVEDDYERERRAKKRRLARRRKVRS